MAKSKRSETALYQQDLAHIHVEGYGFHWSGAAEAILAWFRKYQITRGNIVDLGCGGGQWLQHLADEGYDICGIDISPSMIRIAKQNAPQANFLCGSFDKIAIPKCQAVTSLGEPLNYLNSGSAMRRTMQHVYKALEPGGLFIFDLRHPATRQIEPRVHQKQTPDWVCTARIEEDHRKNQLTRFITTFVRQKNGNYRRCDETHKLKIYPRKDITTWLRNIGFQVRTYRSYGEYQLGPRQSVFVCRKPA